MNLIISILLQNANALQSYFGSQIYHYDKYCLRATNLKHYGQTPLHMKLLSFRDPKEVSMFPFLGQKHLKCTELMLDTKKVLSEDERLIYCYGFDFRKIRKYYDALECYQVPFENTCSDSYCDTDIEKLDSLHKNMDLFHYFYEFSKIISQNNSISSCSKFTHFREVYQGRTKAYYSRIRPTRKIAIAFLRDIEKFLGSSKMLCYTDECFFLHV